MGDEILVEQTGCLDLMEEYNAIPRRKIRQRGESLRKLFAEVGEGCYIEFRFYANWSGHHVHLGKNVHANYCVTFVDDTHIHIGAGSVVTKDIPSGVVAVGNPCKVLREVGRHGREYYFRDRRSNPGIFEKK